MKEKKIVTLDLTDCKYLGEIDVYKRQALQMGNVSTRPMRERREPTALC